MIYDLKISLNCIEPSIWRRILVPDNIFLDELHALIQLSMGWETTHLYSFEINKKTYMDDPDEEFNSIDPETITLQEVLAGQKEFNYIYDFGDEWQHTIKIMNHAEAKVNTNYPLCVGGENACPPEDCGGFPGYNRLLKALSDTSHDEHEEMLAWVGGYFDPKGFDANMVNRIFRMPQPQEEMDMFLEGLVGRA